MTKLFASLLLSSALATGCSQKPQVITLERATELDKATTGHMMITGTATLEVSPDCADLTMTLSTEAVKPGAAAASVQAKQQDLIARLATLGVETSDIKLSHVSLDPVYHPNLQWQPIKVRGYVASVTITATTKSFGKIGAMMELGADAGATSMSSQFRRSDLAELKKKVRDMALAAAKAKAAQTAGALDLDLGRIVSVAENAGGMWNQTYFPQASNAMAVSSEPGGGAVALGGTLQPLTLDITIGYELARG